MSVIVRVNRSPRSALPVRFFLSALLLITALVSFARPARADVAVAVLGLDAIDIPEETAALITDALRARAEKSQGVRLLPGKELAEVKLIFGCMDEKPVCLAQAGRSMGADRLVYGSLRRPRGASTYTLVLKQLSVRADQVDRFVSEPVPARVLTQGNAELSALAQRWLGVVLLNGLLGGLEITSDPPGAQVTLDGVAVGQAPLQLRDVAAGSHVAQLTLPGYAPMVRTIEVKGGLTHEVHVALARRGAPAPDKDKARAQAASAHHDKAQEREKQRPAPPAPQAAAPPPQSKRARQGRDLKIASYFLIGAAAVAGGVSIYTWRTYSDEQAPARQALDVLQMNVASSPEVNAFFQSADRLSSCEPPAELTMRAMMNPTTVTAYNQYLEHCRRGRTHATATNAMWATMGSLALLGVASYVLGDQLSRAAKKAESKAQASGKPPWLYTPRLTLISPVVNNKGGGVNLSFEF
jgi:hypothetical protein